MSADLLALGVSHKTAPVALRERLALPEGRASGFLNELVGHEAIREAVAISTCNRTELYLVVGDPVEAESVALSALARQAELRPTELLGRLYALRDVEAVRHLFQVAGGLSRFGLVKSSPDEVIDVHLRMFLPVTVNAAIPLFHPIWVPRYFVMNELPAVILQVDAFGCGIRREQNADR